MLVSTIVKKTLHLKQSSGCTLRNIYDAIEDAMSNIVLAYLTSVKSLRISLTFSKCNI
jgi:hypothetical protein